MATHDERHSFVQKVREETQRYIKDLLEENDNLRRARAGLESERAQLENDKHQLREKLAMTCEQLEFSQSELERLRGDLASIADSSRATAERFVDVEARNNELANLYVASYRLHETLDRDEVLSAVNEIIINLVGSEEFAVFELDAARTELRRIGAFGLEPHEWTAVTIDGGIAARVVQTGRIHINGECAGCERDQSRYVAWIPLKLGVEVIGAIGIFSLLPQKVDGLVDLDREIFDLLATQAGTALYCTGLHARVEATRQDN
jgi:hypothetical protein